MLVEERIDFAVTKIAFNGLSKKSMSDNLRFKIVKEKQTSCTNSLRLIHTKENIKSVYLEKICKLSFVLKDF